MMEEPFEFSHKKELETSIDTFKDILNEMCCTVDEYEFNIEMLNVSHHLDKLIVEYMDLKKQ